LPRKKRTELKSETDVACHIQATLAATRVQERFPAQRQRSKCRTGTANRSAKACVDAQGVVKPFRPQQIAGAPAETGQA
jgi:hypothetical protein